MVLQVNVSIASNRNLVQNIELLIELIKRDLKAKYKNTFLGILWIVLQPMLFAALFILISKNVPLKYTITKLDYLDMFAVLIPWQFFVTALQRSISSIEANNQLIYRIKFPIILLPISVVIAAFVDALINIFIYFILVLIFKKLIFTNFIFLIMILLVGSISVTTLSILFSLLVCYFGDIRQIVPFFIQLSLFGLPIFYSEDVFHGFFKVIYEHIPLVWMIVSAKEVISSYVNLSFSFFFNNVLFISIFSFLFVYFIFKKMERWIVDYI